MTLTGRLRWRCRRGMRELDLLLENYLDQSFASAGSDEQKAFIELLALEDARLQSYLMGQRIPENEMMAEIVQKIKKMIS